MISRSISKPMTLISVGAIALLSVSACAGETGQGSGDAQTQSVELLLPGTLGLDWAAFNVAVEKYWPEMGLDVSGIASDGSAAVVQQLAAGNAQYGVASAASVYGGASEGADVKAIAMLTHGDVAMLSVPEDSPIQSAEELQGGAIGVTSASDGAIPIVAAVMASVGVTDWGQPIVGAGGAAVVNAFETGQIQSYAHGGGDLVAMQVGGTPLRSILPAEFTDLPGNMMIVPQSVIDDEAQLEVAEKLTAGWLKAAAWLLENPDEAIEINCRQHPQSCTDDEVTAFSIALAAEGTAPVGDPAGSIDETATTTLLEAVYGELTVPVGEVFTNEHADAIAAY
jgi:NitT/TauT family transport system substrate-binding protein